jgi:hypothetical protein
MDNTGTGAFAVESCVCFANRRSELHLYIYAEQVHGLLQLRIVPPVETPRFVSPSDPAFAAGNRSVFGADEVLAGNRVAADMHTNS